LLLHASAVETAGRAILLVGDSGAGKSTGAAALVALGAAPLADDGVVVALRAGAPWAVAGPLRSNPFSRGAKRLLHGRLSRRAPDGPARLVPVGAVVFLRRGPAPLERLGGRAAFLALAGPHARPEVEETAEAVVRSVPVAAAAPDRAGRIWGKVYDLGAVQAAPT
jgi:energy-coupling factor transporter ATP-binding protein EcfA2